VRLRLITIAAVLLVLKFSGDRFLVYARLVVLHFAFLTDEINVGVFSSWHGEWL